MNNEIHSDYEIKIYCNVYFFRRHQVLLSVYIQDVVQSSLVSSRIGHVYQSLDGDFRT